MPLGQRQGFRFADAELPHLFAFGTHRTSVGKAEPMGARSCIARKTTIPSVPPAESGAQRGTALAPTRRADR